MIFFFYFYSCGNSTTGNERPIEGNVTRLIMDYSKTALIIVRHTGGLHTHLISLTPKLDMNMIDSWRRLTVDPFDVAQKKTDSQKIAKLMSNGHQVVENQLLAQCK